MSDSKRQRPGIDPRPRSAGDPVPGSPRPQGSGAPAGADGTAGKVTHDRRGNAVWDWLVETGRNAIESTSRLLRKLEVPDLKIEEKKDEELRLTDDDAGGGYDPYNQRTPRRPGRK